MHENTTKRKKSASVNKENETLGLVSKEEENDNLRGNESMKNKQK